MAYIAVPEMEPEYDAHLSRVQRMQDYIASLLGPNAPELAPASAGMETLTLKSGRTKVLFCCVCDFFF